MARTNAAWHREHEALEGLIACHPTTVDGLVALGRPYGCSLKTARTMALMKAEHQRADRGKGMPVQGPKIDGPACAAPRTEYLEPRRSGEQRCADGGRPQHVAVDREAGSSDR
jgi:hypothetical protein